MTDTLPEPHAWEVTYAARGDDCSRTKLVWIYPTIPDDYEKIEAVYTRSQVEKHTEALRARVAELEAKLKAQEPAIKAAGEWLCERTINDWAEADLAKAMCTLSGDWPGCPGCDQSQCDEPCVAATVAEQHANIDRRIAQLVHEGKLLASDDYKPPKGWKPITIRKPRNVEAELIKLVDELKAKLANSYDKQTIDILVHQITGHDEAADGLGDLQETVRLLNGERIIDLLNKEHDAKLAEAGKDAARWRCFHCDAVFTGQEAAAEHFGATQEETPLCQISGSHVRWLEAQIKRCAEEDSEALRALRSLACEHETLRRRAEEEGYARGLADAKKHPGELGLQAISAIAAKEQP